MKLIKTTMSFIVAMTALLIVAVQLGTFDKLMAWRAQPQTTNLNVNVDVNGGQTQPGVLVLDAPAGDVEPVAAPVSTSLPAVTEATPPPTVESVQIYEAMVNDAPVMATATATRKPSGVPFLDNANDGVITPNEFSDVFGWGPTRSDGGCNVLPPLACPTPSP